MDERYHTQHLNPSPDCPEHQGNIHDEAIGAVIGAMPTVDLADLPCGPAGNRSGMRRIGDKWVGICPLPDCAANLPSFAVWPGNDSWRCFCCMRGGSATDLARLAGYALVAKARQR
jgi:CHC2 zinc finger